MRVDNQLHGLFAPKRTPADIVGTLNVATVEALADPAVRSRIADLGSEIFPREEQTPEALVAMQRADAEKWWPIIKVVGHQSRVNWPLWQFPADQAAARVARASLRY
jgi:tripartite-type tricarboxylate transporter receptor subunit TctC